MVTQKKDLTPIERKWVCRMCKARYDSPCWVKIRVSEYNRKLRPEACPFRCDKAMRVKPHWIEIVPKKG